MTNTASPEPSPAVPTIPVVCDKCRAEGIAGDPEFEGIADILDFEPVPRRANVNAWTPEHQRAFIIALAITGSPWRAALGVGRQLYGAERLRKAKGGRGFDRAWDEALAIAKDREMARMRDNLAKLREQEATAADRDGLDAAAEPGGGADEFGWDEEEDPERREYLEAQERIRERLLRARRLLLGMIANDPEKRAAWEVLVGPVDWEKAENFEPQDNEPFPVSMLKADMLLTVEGGMLHDVVGAGRDFTGEVQQAVTEYRETGKWPGEGEAEDQNEGN
jgi:hypothetical protein